MCACTGARKTILAEGTRCIHAPTQANFQLKDSPGLQLMDAPAKWLRLVLQEFGLQEEKKRKEKKRKSTLLSGNLATAQ